jgi:hypothetical protein
MKHQKTSDLTRAFTARGFDRAEVFSHRVCVIPKRYPDTLLLLNRHGICELELKAGAFYQMNLYARDVSDFPRELFTDRGLNWHNQQLGEDGLIAAASLYAQDDALIVVLMQSDLCQQLHRHAELKRTCRTQVQKRFGAWHRMLFNAILDSALYAGFASVYTPAADWLLSRIKKPVQPDLFRRIYDSVAARYECRKVTRNSAEYWEVPLMENADRVVRLTPSAPEARKADQRPLICVFHDIEENVDADVSVGECSDNLVAMLGIEKSRRVRATYNVVGTCFASKRQQIWNCDNGHSLGFHSFNHDLADETQLTRCRQVDLQVKGYRPPQSKITPELTDYRLSYFNFEWLASGERSLGVKCCTLQNGIVKIPILTDDYPLFTGSQDYAEWEHRLLECARTRSFLAFSLHDCYGKFWINHYDALLEKLAAIGSFVTAEELSNRVFRENSIAFPIQAQREQSVCQGKS